MALRKLFYLLPPRVRFLARRIYYLPLDIYENLAGKKEPLTPPRGLIFTGGGDFLREGRQAVEIIKKDGGLLPNHRVLDIGCGMGRIAIALTGYLDSSGSYEGFDIIALGISWCRKNIGKKFPNFEFTLTKLQNDLYSNTGRDARNFKFPYEKEDFDFAVANSLFTHLQPAEVENYLFEIARVLKKGGKVYCTFFLYESSTDYPFADDPTFDFKFDCGHYRLMSKRVKSANVAYQKSYMEDLFSKSGFEILRFFPGYWKKGGNGSNFQDIYLLLKV